MLYDPKWNTPDVYSLEGLISWLEKQSVDGGYNWPQVDGCLACNYLRAVTGNKSPWANGDKMYKEIFSSIDEYYDVCMPEPWTYGAALERARKIYVTRGEC